MALDIALSSHDRGAMTRNVLAPVAPSLAGRWLARFVCTAGPARTLMASEEEWGRGKFIHRRDGSREGTCRFSPDTVE